MPHSQSTDFPRLQEKDEEQMIEKKNKNNATYHHENMGFTGVYIIFLISYIVGTR